jgi:hypothetical protein
MGIVAGALALDALAAKQLTRRRSGEEGDRRSRRSRSFEYEGTMYHDVRRSSGSGKQREASFGDGQRAGRQHQLRGRDVMKALTWHGRGDIRYESVPDPSIVDPTDAIVRITSTAICGSDLHLYDGFNPFMLKGDVLGHEPMGIVEEVGPNVHAAAARRPCGGAVHHLVRHLLLLQQGRCSRCARTRTATQRWRASSWATPRRACSATRT